MGGGTSDIPAWQDRAAMVKQLIEAGLQNQVFLACDWMFGLTIAPTGTLEVPSERNPFGNLFNVRNIIPYLRQIGVTDAQIREITVTNPRNSFARG